MAASKRTRRAARVKFSAKGKKRSVVVAHVQFALALGNLHEALSIVATACDALEHAEDRQGSVAARDVGRAILTLRHGVKALCRAYDEVDGAPKCAPA